MWRYTTVLLSTIFCAVIGYFFSNMPFKMAYILKNYKKLVSSMRSQNYALVKTRPHYFTGWHYVNCVSV